MPSLYSCIHNTSWNGNSVIRQRVDASRLFCALAVSYLVLISEREGYILNSSSFSNMLFTLRYDLELHIAHLSSYGEIAVVGIVYKYGRPDRFLKKVHL